MISRGPLLHFVKFLKEDFQNKVQGTERNIQYYEKVVKKKKKEACAVLLEWIQHKMHVQIVNCSYSTSDDKANQT